MRLATLAWPLAALPAPLGFAWATAAVQRYEGWGQWAAAPMLLLPLGYGLLVALAASGAAWRAHRARRSSAAALLGCAIAMLPWLVVVARNLAGG